MGSSRTDGLAGPRAVDTPTIGPPDVYHGDADLPTIAAIEPVAAVPVAARAPRPGRVASDASSALTWQIVDFATPWILGLATLIARVATAAAGPTDWDSAQLAAAVYRFDVTHGRPQPPGYWLYVESGRGLHALGLGVISSLVTVSAVASAVAVGLVVVAGRSLGGRWTGIAAGLLVATCPFAWYSGSVVDTYSFDLLIAPLLIILAWRARPHSWHGVAAVGALGLAAGFRQSSATAFALLALMAVVGSVRRVREAAVVVLVGAVSVGLWIVPMVLSQPGGAAVWARATRLESQGAAQSTSILDHAIGWPTNMGTFAAYTVVALAPLTLLAVLAGLVLVGRGLTGRFHLRNTPRNPGPLPTTAAGLADNGIDGNRDMPHPPDKVWQRPWYQSRTVILIAAIVPPAAAVALVEFAKGGYLLAYLPGTVIALLLVPAALVEQQTDRAATRGRTTSRLWLTLGSLAVLAIAVLGADRFLAGTGVLPVAASTTDSGAWLTQLRYQAPYLDTRSAIRSADAVDAGFAGLAPFVNPRRDVIVLDVFDGGQNVYRNAGWELLPYRISLLAAGDVQYNELDGSLYYAPTPSSTIAVGPDGSAYLVAQPNIPGLGALVRAGSAVEVRGAPKIADYRVWRIRPGTSLLNVEVVATRGPRPLGFGLGLGQ